jgi:hypothetical protein
MSSDDESDLHPNIDKDSWFRMKHRHRLEREEREDEEIRVMRRDSAVDQRRLNVVKARMNGVGEKDISVRLICYPKLFLTYLSDNCM